MPRRARARGVETKGLVLEQITAGAERPTAATALGGPVKQT